MKKKTLTLVLCVTTIASLLIGCTDSSKQTSTKDAADTGYNVKDEVAAFKMGELNDTEKDYTVEMGYYNCDHMCGSIIGEKAGIYEALGLKVNVTKSPETIKALSSGQMDVGYLGIEGAIRAVNGGAKFFMAAANHMGGSRYFVVSNDIKEPSDLIGKSVAISTDATIDPEWITWASELNIPVETSNYQCVEMGQQDAMFALKAGQISGFTCCDPYASIATYEGFGHVIETGWGAANVEADSDLDDWGLCCIYGMSNTFKETCPELARRLVFAHELALKYIYEHPYNAAMMFADGFDVEPAVALRTIYMKTVAEGRTLTWRFTEGNIKSDHEYYTQYPQIPAEEIPTIDNFNQFVSADLAEDAGLEDFETFLKEKVDPITPIGMSMKDWYEKAKEIDQISENEAADISVFLTADKEASK